MQIGNAVTIAGYPSNYSSLISFMRIFSPETADRIDSAPYISHRTATSANDIGNCWGQGYYGASDLCDRAGHTKDGLYP
jgi:hypothetical protein